MTVQPNTTRHDENGFTLQVNDVAYESRVGKFFEVSYPDGGKGTILSGVTIESLYPFTTNPAEHDPANNARTRRFFRRHPRS